MAVKYRHTDGRETIYPDHAAIEQFHMAGASRDGWSVVDGEDPVAVAENVPAGDGGGSAPAGADGVHREGGGTDSDAEGSQEGDVKEDGNESDAA